jgi:hypothetical protein
MKHKQVTEFMKENKLLIFLFVISTLLFIFQNVTYLYWDFASYSLNARYLFYNGTYFETLRPPLPSVILGFFMLFKPPTNYFYILFVSSLFLFSLIKFSDIIFYEYLFDKKISKESLRFVLYFFSLSYFVLLFGLREGTEMLSLSFFILFITFLIQGKTSGHFLALAFLSRYSFIIYFPLLFASRKIKIIIRNILLFLAIIFPWLLFNYLKFGNWFTSIVDAYANNILFRQELMMPFNYHDLLFVLGIFLPFFVIGVYYSLKEMLASKKRFCKENLILFLILIIFIICLIDYSKIPLKNMRYLFNLSFPIAFFSAIGFFSLIKNKKVLKRISLILLIVFIITASLVFTLLIKISPLDNKFRYVTEDIRGLGIENCEILSPHWVLVTYYTENVYPLGGIEIATALREGKVILIFPNNPTPDDNYNEKDLNNSVLLKKDNYVFLYDTNRSIKDCSKKYTFNPPYVHNHCEIISQRVSKLGIGEIALKICNSINK